MDKMIRVKFSGGREASGFLKGYDPLLNIVLDNTVEFLRGKRLYKHSLIVKIFKLYYFRSRRSLQVVRRDSSPGFGCVQRNSSGFDLSS
jgi:small nuclear ribonucleoprotein (snRNP)-like protein